MKYQITSVIEQLKAATTWSEWLSAMRGAKTLYILARDQNRFCYDSRLARQLGDALAAEPSHELVSAHCGDSMEQRDWGRRVLAVGSVSDTRRARLRRLTPGPHGGLFVTQSP